MIGAPSAGQTLFSSALVYLILSKLAKTWLTPTWFEHAAFWSGVRRATVAPRSQVFKVPPRFELGSLDSKSRVLTITPWNPKVSIVTSKSDQHMREMQCRTGWKEKWMFPAGFEPATLCVWSTRDNHYTKETWMFLLSKCNCTTVTSAAKTTGGGICKNDNHPIWGSNPGPLD